MQSIDHPALAEIKAIAAVHPRQSGYYLIDMVAIHQELAAGTALLDVLDDALEHMDDQIWAPKSERPQDQSWQDYMTTSDNARLIAIDALMGGPSIGQTRYAMTTARAGNIWAKFTSLFSGDVQWLTGVGLGDAAYVFQNGVAAFDSKHMGILCVVEND